MAKRKKKSTRVISLGFGAKNLEAELNRAEKYLANKDWNAARNILLPLSEQYPDDQRVWEYLSYVSYELGNTKLYQKACEAMVRLKPQNTQFAYVLGSVYMSHAHPLMALQTFRRALSLDPDHEYAENARKSVEVLQKLADNLLADLGLSDQAGWEIALLHEQGQAYLEEGDYGAARKAENEVLQYNPDFLSARNNLSLISWQEGNVEDAIATAQTVLEQDSDNIHALSNLVRFLALKGDEAAARSYAERLKASQANAWDGWTKKVEGMTYLRDDATVLEIFEQAQATDALEKDAPSPMFFYLVGVAFAQLGHKDEAVAQWQQALANDEAYPLAKDNLADIRHTVGLRHGAWPFSWDQWLLPRAAADFTQTLDASLKSESRKKHLDKNLKTYLAHHPDFLRKVPIILERGGPRGQELILMLGEQLRTSELLVAIKDFALSQNGPDQLRNRAAILAAQEKLIPKKVTLWLEDEWREIQLLAYEFHGEPLYDHVEPVEELLKHAIYLLREMNKEAAEEAETLLRQALEIEPEAPDTLNNLSKALELQGRQAEASELLEELPERFPDYLFARMGKAKEHIFKGDLDAAEALILPVLERDRFHFLEFSAFSDAYITLLMAQKNWKGARTWFDMWERVNPDDPRLDYWEDQVEQRIWIPK